MRKKSILHVVSQLPEKYNSKFIAFSKEHLTEYENTFMVLTTIKETNEFDESKIVNFKHVSKIKKIISIGKYLLNRDYDLVVFHGIFYKGLFLAFLALLMRTTQLPQRALWMTWGGDIYYFQNRKNTISGFLNEFLRKSIFKKIYFISSLIPDELELIKVNYQSRAIHLNAFYPNPTTYKTDVDDVDKHSDGNKLNFLIGNSADPQNNHIELLQSLSHLSGSIKVFCILSYAIVDEAYVENVKRIGHELFAENFFPVEQFMTPQDYKVFINNIDIACYYHNRQQAMGNIFQFLYMGKTVFLRPDTLSYMFLQDYGFSIQNSNKLSRCSLEELKDLVGSNANNTHINRQTIDDHFSDKAAKEKWQLMLNKIFAFVKKKQSSNI
jgi:dTDP-N-acetylfucosamine:lipid II N-acetylfucosaminyltransferase